MEEGQESIIELLPAANRIIVHRLEQLDGTRQRHEGHCKDDRHNTAHANLHWNVGGLTAILLSANHTFCILNRNPAFGVVHEYNEGNHCNEDDQNCQRFKEIPLRVFLGEFHQCTHHGREACEDTSKQQHRNAVADAVIIDPVAHPNNDTSTGDEAKHNDNAYEHVCSCRVIRLYSIHTVFQGQIIRNGHEHCQSQSHSSSNLIQDFLSFFALIPQSL